MGSENTYFKNVVICVSSGIYLKGMVMGFLLFKDEHIIPNISEDMAHNISNYPSFLISRIKSGDFRSKSQFTSGTVVLILTIGSLDPGSIPGRVVLQLR